MAPNPTPGALPPQYAQWVTALLGGTIPRETRATCHDCVMVATPTTEAEPRGIYFDSAIKCCTYIPNLPNFLVGQILAGTDADDQEGRTSVEQRIKDGVGVTPLGLSQPPVFSLLYSNSEEFFGRSRALRCPHYLEDSGRCGIWRNRNATCSTWFCKHDRGAVGYAFWQKCLHKLLFVVERDLARWSMLELGPSHEVLQRLVTVGGWTLAADTVTGDSVDNQVNHSDYVRIWGAWRGHEREFFMRCAELVQPLSWTEVLAISGPEARAYADLTKAAYARLTSNEVPSTLNVGSFQIVQIQKGMTRVNAYSCYDPFDIPERLMELLPYFDGRATEDILTAIAEERGVRIDPALVRKMVDFGLLSPGSPTRP